MFSRGEVGLVGIYCIYFSGESVVSQNNINMYSESPKYVND